MASKIAATCNVCHAVSIIWENPEEPGTYRVARCPICTKKAFWDGWRRGYNASAADHHTPRMSEDSPDKPAAASTPPARWGI